MSGFHNLSNGEIVFVYLSNLKTLKSVDGMIEKKEIESSVPFLGTEISFRLSLDEEHIDKIVTHGYYQNLLSSRYSRLDYYNKINHHQYILFQ